MIRTAEIAVPLSDSHLSDGIPEVDVATLAQVANDAAAGPRRHLWHPGDPANEVYVLHSDEVRTSSSTRTELRSVSPARTGYNGGRAGLLLGRADMAVSTAVVIRLVRRGLNAFHAATGRPDFRLLRFAAKAAATSSSTWTDWVLVSRGTGR